MIYLVDKAKHLKIKNIEDKDIDRLVSLDNDWQTSYYAQFHTRPVSKEEIISELKATKFPNAYWGIYQNDLLIGICTIGNVDLISSKCEIAISLTSKNQNHGLGSLALRLLITYIFDNLNLHKITLHVLSFNKAAIHVYEKLGFKRQGVLREDAFKFGRYYDSYYYELLKSEWKNQKITSK